VPGSREASRGTRAPGSQEPREPGNWSQKARGVPASRGLGARKPARGHEPRSQETEAAIS